MTDISKDFSRVNARLTNLTRYVDATMMQVQRDMLKIQQKVKRGGCEATALSLVQLEKTKQDTKNRMQEVLGRLEDMDFGEG